MRKLVSGSVCAVLAAVLAGGVVLEAAADKPQVIKARIIRLHKTNYEIQVLVQHDDTSWDHYADRWEVIGPGGKILGTRVLFHPHIGELQFVRNLRGVTIPEGVSHVIIRAHDKVHGNSRERLIEMPPADKNDTGFK